jgi:hypothetical protein
MMGQIDGQIFFNVRLRFSHRNETAATEIIAKCWIVDFYEFVGHKQTFNEHANFFCANQIDQL